MRTLGFAALAFAALVAGPTGQAQPRSGGGGGVVVAPGRGAPGTPGWGPGGGRWVGGPHRPWVGPRHGFGGWGWGWGYPGFGWGVGLGYGTGWALSTGWPWWYWGAPPALYAVPSWGPHGYTAQVFPGFDVQENLTFVQQAPDQIFEPAPAAPPARAPVSYWYYCTEPQGYYPYVQQCSRPWIAVNPASLPPPAEARPGTPPP